MSQPPKTKMPELIGEIFSIARIQKLHHLEDLFYYPTTDVCEAMLRDLTNRETTYKIKIEPKNEQNATAPLLIESDVAFIRQLAQEIENKYPQYSLTMRE